MIPPIPSPEEPARGKARGKLIGYIVIGALLLLVASIVIPVYGQPCPKAQRTKFLSQMKSVFPALKMYAGDHEGKFPPQLGDLEPEYLSEGMIARLHYKDAKTGVLIEPIYFPGYTDFTPAGTILLTSTISVGEMRIIVCADGSAQVIRDARYQELLKQQPPREW